MTRAGWLVMLVVGTGGCSKAEDELDRSRIELAKVQVRKIAHEAYPQWAVSKPDQQCPKSLAELEPFLGNANAMIDPWQQPFKFVCGPDAPPAVKGLGAYSLGPDGKEGTADDIKSWDARK